MTCAELKLSGEAYWRKFCDALSLEFRSPRPRSHRPPSPHRSSVRPGPCQEVVDKAVMMVQVWELTVRQLSAAGVPVLVPSVLSSGGARSALLPLCLARCWNGLVLRERMMGGE